MYGGAQPTATDGPKWRLSFLFQSAEVARVMLSVTSGMVDSLAHVGSRYLEYCSGITHLQKCIYAFYYAIALWFICTFLRGFFFKGWGMPKFGLIFFRSLVVRTHALCGGFLLLTSLMWWTFSPYMISVPLLIHTVTSFALIPDMHGVKVTAWTTVVLGVLINSWELMESLQRPWTTLDHYRIFHALSGFTHTRFWVVLFKLCGFGQATYATAMTMSGMSGICLTLGPERGIVTYWGLASVLFCVRMSMEGVLQSTITRVMSSHTSDEHASYTASSRLKALQGDHPRTFLGAQSQALMEFMESITDPLLLAAKFLDQDGDGVISREDMRKYIVANKCKAGPLFDACGDWQQILITDAISEKQSILRAIANDMAGALLDRTSSNSESLCPLREESSPAASLLCPLREASLPAESLCPLREASLPAESLCPLSEASSTSKSRCLHPCSQDDQRRSCTGPALRVRSNQLCTKQHAK